MFVEVGHAGNMGMTHSAEGGGEGEDVEQKVRTGNRMLLILLIVERLVNCIRSSTVLYKSSSNSRACGNLYSHTRFEGFLYEGTYSQTVLPVLMTLVLVTV